MTMLDQMRRHKGWLKWSLGLVVLAFIIFYIPDFLQPSGATIVSGETIATVEGREITAGEFRRTYDAQLQAYRNAYGGTISEQLLRQLGVDEQILQQLVDQQVALAEAERLGIRASDEEVRQRILSAPAFQENGVFIGEQRYQQLLRSQVPPMTAAAFENAVREEIVVEKLRSVISDWLSIPEEELEREYRLRNDKVKLAMVTFLTDTFRTDVTAGDEEIAAHFAANTEDFRIPEKRKIRYLLVDVEEMRAKVNVPESSIAQAYNDNIDQYSTPDQVRASHILFRIGDADEAAVRAEAEKVLAEIRAGADFAELARMHSDDEATAVNGGDLDFFGRGRMVPQFDEAVFAMEAGQVSDLVRTDFGFHIIKVVEKRPGTMRTLDEVRPQLQTQLALEMAQAQAADLAEALADDINDPSDLDAVAKSQGLTVQESDFFSREESIPTLGAAPEVVARAFTMSEGEVDGPLTASRGFVFQTLTGVQASYIPKPEEVTDQVRDAVIREKALARARERATEVAGRLKGAADFDRAAKAAGVEPKTTELITRESPVPDLGLAPEVTEAAFALPVGALSDPIVTEAGIAVVKVLEKAEVTDAEWASNVDTFRDEMLADRRGRFFAAYMSKAKQRMRIELNRETLLRALP
jgi:peptidyl-prolyl cis-trans isomerase D